MKYGWRAIVPILLFAGTNVAAQEQSRNNAGAYAQQVEALLTCKADRAAFRAFSLGIGDPVTGVVTHGWNPVAGSDASYPHYAVTGPLYVMGFEVREIIFTANAMLALIDTHDGPAVAKVAGLTEGQYERKADAFYGVKQVYLSAPQNSATPASPEQRHLLLTSETAPPQRILIGCAYSDGVAPAKP